MRTTNDVSLVIRDLEYDRCKRAETVGTECDGNCVTCHSRVFSELASMLQDAFDEDVRQTEGTPGDEAVSAMGELIGQIGDWSYSQCVMATRVFGEGYVKGCSADCEECHRMICNAMADRVLHAWVEALSPGDGDADGTGAAGGQGILIDGRPDARDRLGYVVAWERDVDGLTVRDPRDVASVRFDAIGAFPTYEAAMAFIRLIRDSHGSGKGWVDSFRRP